MKILLMGTTCQVVGAALGAALCMAGVSGYSAAPPGTGNSLPHSPSVAGARDADPTASTDAVARACQCTADTYAIVNLVPGIGYRTRINARGEAAFEYVSPDIRLRVGFFDGERMSNITPTGADVASLGDMNAKGEVALYGALPSSAGFNLLPFRWSRAAGWTLLPVLSADGDTFLGAINNNGIIIGSSGIAAGEAGFRAARWSAANSLHPLTTADGFGESMVSEINEHDVSVGYANNAANVTHAFIWNAAGAPTNLGTFGATEAAGLVNNNRGDVAGWLNFSGSDFQSFLWSPGKGVIRAGLHTIPGDLNNVGELVGRIYYPDTQIDHAYLFSRARGLVDLHRAPFASSDASQADDKGTVVGQMSNNSGDFAQRAYRWGRGGEAVDLNSRLLDVPDGLVVTGALRIASNGDIIANSNAGLVLLRRSGGTNAPVLGPIVIGNVDLGVPFSLSLGFRDRNKRDTHSATLDWGDGSGPQPIAISEYQGRGSLSAAHTYATPGDYNIVVRVTDSTGRSTVQAQPVYILPPLLQGIVGEGNLPAADARPGRPTLMFRLAAPLAATPGATRPFTFVLQGRVAFQGERLDRVSRNGNTITLEGTGKLNGQAGFRFRIDARDGQHGGALAADRLALRIERADPSGGAPAAGERQAVFSYGVADSKADAGAAAREGILPPSALRLIH